MRERRQFPRILHTCEARYRAWGSLVEGWIDVTILNVSAGGLRFRCGELLRVGDHLEVQLRLPADPQPVTVRGQVVWSKMPAAGVAENGVGFLDVTPEQSERIDDLVRFLKGRAAPPD